MLISPHTSRAKSGGKGSTCKLSTGPILAGGFTLIELAVVVVMLGLLVTLLGSVWKDARRAALDVTCSGILADFGAAMQQYAAENQDWIPGVNTSGVATRAKRLMMPDDPNGYCQPHVPVQSYDWMTPLASYINPAELPANRAERWHHLWTTYKCPSVKWTNDFVWGNPPDADDFAQYTYPVCSYLSPCYFHHWGAAHQLDVVGYMEGLPRPIPIPARTLSVSWPVQPPAEFVSRLSEIGPPASKIFVADGTRYVMESGHVDFDINLDPAYFGAFNSSGGWWSISSTYGVAPGTLNWDGDTIADGSPSGGLNLYFSYRHPPGTPPAPADALCETEFTGAAQDNHGGINALFFDGHVERLNDQMSRAIEMWHPTGSVVQGDPVGMTTVPPGYEIP